MSEKSAPANSPPLARFLGVQVADLKRDELVDWLAEKTLEPSDRAIVAFALHVGGLLELRGNPPYADAMASADIVYADGVSAQVLARFAGAQQVERAVTTDIGWMLLVTLTRQLGRPPRVALLGGRPGLAEQAMDKLVDAGLASGAFTGHGYEEDWTDTLRSLSGARPEIVFVGMGAPREMLWVQAHLASLPAALTLTCGGWFGYIVGEEPRAPALMRRFYLEWLFRLYLQPRRLGGRYFRGLVRFPYLLAIVLRDRVTGKRRTS
jgi:N-acetylglucosaminyldiphosphoundecaprenol N-acetyl-beta-D-mannosaminyltransferase